MEECLASRRRARCEASLLQVQLDLDSDTKPGMYLKDIVSVTKAIQLCIESQASGGMDYNRLGSISHHLKGAVDEVKRALKQASESDRDGIRDFCLERTNAVISRCEDIGDFYEIPEHVSYKIVEQLMQSRKELAKMFTSLRPNEAECRLRRREIGLQEAQEFDDINDRGQPYIFLLNEYEFNTHLGMWKADQIKHILDTYRRGMEAAWDGLLDPMTICTTLRETFNNIRQELSSFLSPFNSCADSWAQELREIDASYCGNTLEGKHTVDEYISTRCKDEVKKLHKCLEKYQPLEPSADIRKTYLAYRNRYDDVVGLSRCVLKILYEVEGYFIKHASRAKEMVSARSKSLVLKASREVDDNDSEDALRKARLEDDASERKRLETERLEDHEDEKTRSKIRLQETFHKELQSALRAVHQVDTEERQRLMEARYEHNGKESKRWREELNDIVAEVKKKIREV